MLWRTCTSIVLHFILQGLLSIPATANRASPLMVEGASMTNAIGLHFADAAEWVAATENPSSAHSSRSLADGEDVRIGGCLQSASRASVTDAPTGASGSSFGACGLYCMEFMRQDLRLLASFALGIACMRYLETSRFGQRQRSVVRGSLGQNSQNPTDSMSQIKFEMYPFAM
eukprot:TRINITY_DN1892_c0_g4_i1.p1 TRINITY_DN1892_c0_g4~~TRINITY_DN1892_c0_g4_i1.p1  ORF type:complete len:172 (-),score=16.41 TRINITY_DN1892_c0_g4_i1:128-643(-)